jgi:hypothetical protein
LASIEDLEVAVQGCIADAERVVTGLGSSGESNQELSGSFAALGNLSVPQMLDGAGQSIKQALEQVTAETETLRQAQANAQAAR